MCVLEHGTFLHHLFSSFFTLFAFVNLWQLEEDKDGANDECKDSESQVWTRHVFWSRNFVTNNDGCDEERSYGGCHRVQSLREGHAECTFLWRTEHHHVRIGYILEHHNTHCNDAHGAEEDGIHIRVCTKYGCDSQRVDNESDTYHCQAKDECALVTNLAHEEREGNGEQVGTIEGRIDILTILGGEVECLRAEGNHGVVHRGHESDEEADNEHYDKRERIVRSLFL